MFKVIDVEETPNPDALKFVLDGTLLSSGVRQFDGPEAGKTDPLASALFSLPGVESVFYMGQFVTVSKKSNIKWSELQPKINQQISANADKTSSAGSSNGSSTKVASDNDALLQKIDRVLDENIRPALAGDGGGIDVLSLDGFRLMIHYQGACGSCPSATAGTMAAVQNLLQRMVDPRIQVISD